MEKIYESEQFEEHSFKHKKKSSLNGSVILSFAVAFFAIFSLIVCGFNEISYAAPDNTFPEKITFYHYQLTGGVDVDIVAGNNGNIIIKGKRTMICLVKANMIPCIGFPMAVKKLEEIGCIKLIKVENRKI